MTILYFIIALGILVIAHEWGHFIIARKSGIRVDEFAIGFGPKLFSYQGKHTLFKVCLLPLGGYVKLYGEDPVSESEGDSKKADEIAHNPEAFSAQSLWKRLATVFGGPIMNLVLAFVLLPLVFMVGRQVPAVFDQVPQVLGVKEDSPALKAGILKDDVIVSIEDDKMEDWAQVLNWIILHPDTRASMTINRGGSERVVLIETTNSPFSDQKIGYTGFEPQFFVGDDPIVGSLSDTSPAKAAGLKEMDKIVAFNGKPMSSWTEMTAAIRASEGKEIELTYLRDGNKQTAKLTPIFHDGSKTWIIGITKYFDPKMMVLKRYAPARAIKEGFSEGWKLVKMTGDVLGRLFTANLSYKALGGPLQIAQASGSAAKSGLGEFLFFMSFLSLQLGILNLLPIPVLDGGHVLFMVIEGIRRKPISMKVRTVLTQLGFGLLMLLMVMITFNDIDRMWGFSKIWAKITGIF